MFLRAGAASAPARGCADPRRSPLWRHDLHRAVPTPVLGVVAALLFVAHLLAMGAGHHTAVATADPQAVASAAAEHSPTHGDALFQAGQNQHSDVGQALKAELPHEAPSCGNTLRLRDGVDVGAVLLTVEWAHPLLQLTEHTPLVAVPASPRPPDLVRELQVQRI